MRMRPEDDTNTPVGAREAVILDNEPESKVVSSIYVKRTFYRIFITPFTSSLLHTILEYIRRITMPPQLKEPSAGFRYTPSSYLQGISSSEDRPWNRSQEDPVDPDLAETLLEETSRPVKRHSTIDSHFVADRIQKRKDLYRGILKGELEVVEDAAATTSASEEGPDEVEYSLSVLSGSESLDDAAHYIKSEQARQARKGRLSGNNVVAVVTPSIDAGAATSKDSEAHLVRNLRAQRLRQAKRLSMEEDDSLEKLRIRRLQQAEDEKRRLQEEAQLKQRLLEEERLHQEQLKRERAQLREERRLLEEAQLRQEQHERHRLARERRAVVKKEDPPGDYSLIEEVQMLFRETGVFKTCVSSCFAPDEDLLSIVEVATRDNDTVVSSPADERRSRTARRIANVGSGLSDLKLFEEEQKQLYYR